MKNLAFLVAAALVLTGCATVQQNVDARALLAQCRWEYSGLSVAGVTFSSGILIDRVDLVVQVKMTNTTKKDVALDHATLTLALDGNDVLDTAHKKFVRVAPGKSVVEPVAVGLPFGSAVKTLGHKPEKIGVKAKLWVTLLVGKDTWETPLVIPVDVEVPIPYDQIQKFIDQRQKELTDEAAKKAKDAAAKAADEAKKLVPKFP